MKPPRSRGDGTKPPRSSDDGAQHPPRDEGHHGDDRPTQPRPPRRPRWPVPGIVITIGGGDKDEKEDKKNKDEKEEKADKKNKDEKEPKEAKEPEPAPPAADEVARPLKYDSRAYRRLADSMLRQERIDAALRMIELLKEQEYFEYTGTFDDDVIAEAEVPEPSGDLADARDLALDYSDVVLTVGKKDKKSKKGKKDDEAAVDAAEEPAADEEKGGKKGKKGKKDDEAVVDEEKGGKKSKKSKKDDETAMGGGMVWEDMAEAACDRVLVLEQEAASLRAIPTASRSASQEQRLAELNVELARASTDLDRLLDDLSRQLGSKDPRVKRLRSADRLTGALARIPGAVALYTVVAEERFWTVVISSAGRAAYSTPIRAEALNRKVLDFRAVLYNPKQDPRPLARELYDIVLGTARANPAFANATTLLWSFDGVLRYVPAAALHDGQGYLVERYRNVVFNRASAETLADAPSGRLEGVGLGVAQKVGSFAPLPAVADELDGIFANAALAGDAGAVPGRVLLDTSFTEPALEVALREGHPVVHIATHFQLSPTSARDSLLLLGDGSLVNVGDIRSIKGSFRGVELLTLSACNTAASGTRADGKEVECFGTIAQERGAKAVIASLWPVSDRSTSALMQTFYKLRASNPTETKAELLRRAQAELLAGRLAVSRGTAADRALVHEEGPAVAGQPTFTPDPSAPFAHPYYWAPFVLIGNCR